MIPNLMIILVTGLAALTFGCGIAYGYWRAGVREGDSSPTQGAVDPQRLAHELNNLLTAIGGFAELARGRADDPVQTGECLDQVAHSVERAAGLTRQLMGTPAPLRRKPAPDLFGRPTILVVDDEDTTRDVAALALSELGYAVRRAAGPEEALETLERMRGDIDLMLTDVMMPGMTGPELARQVARRYPHIPAVYMSGFENRRLAEGRVIGRGEICLSKPFTITALSKAIETALSRRQPGGHREVA